MVTARALYDLWESNTSVYMANMDREVLGIDIGTTSVKACIINTRNNEVLASMTKDTQANVISDTGYVGNKQNVVKIMSALNNCVAKLPRQHLSQVSKIGICGQMHGVVFWKNERGKKAWERVEKDKNVRYDVMSDRVSGLYTWQDNRCSPAFLATLPKPESHLGVYSGYGTATIFWFMKNKPAKLDYFNRAGTIADFAVAMLCNLDYPVMSDQNAASWGYFDCLKGKWNMVTLEGQKFPTNFLPEIQLSGAVAGALADNWHYIPRGTPIGIGLGDLQCSVLSTIESSKDAVLNISTSAQITFVAENFRPTSGPPLLASVEYFPYFNKKYIAVAASLNGGNCLATFVKMLQQWVLDLGHSTPQSKVWDTVLSLSDEDDASTNLTIKPTCLGERNDPNLQGSMANINVGNLRLGQVFRALCRGMVTNIHSMMPREMLQNAKINRIVGNGSGLARNKVLQKEIQLIYKLPLVFTSGGDAAKGAALAVKSM